MSGRKNENGKYWCSVCSNSLVKEQVDSLMKQGMGYRRIFQQLAGAASKNGIRSHVEHTRANQSAVSASANRGRFLENKPMGRNFPKDNYSVSIDEVAGTGEGTTHTRPKGTLVTQADVIKDFGLDPEEWEVTSLKRSFWEQSKGLDDGSRDIIELESIKASFKAVPRSSPGKVKLDYEEVSQRIAQWSFPLTSQSLTLTKENATTFVSLVSDWQLGKVDRNGGTDHTVNNILRSLVKARHRIKELLNAGRNIEKIAFLGLGDILESCSGHYAMQTFLTDLNMREQRRLAWQLGMKATYLFADLNIPIYWTAVSGNHDENRKDGKAYTTFDDSDALLMLDVMKDLCKVNSDLSHVDIELPENPMVQMVNLSGVNVGLVHGHQFRSGTNSSAKVEKWWSNQTFGLNLVKDAHILFNGHFHHFNATEFSENGRTTIQAPSQDPGSEWFTGTGGHSSAPGMLTLLVGEGLSNNRHYSDMQIL